LDTLPEWEGAPSWDGDQSLFDRLAETAPGDELWELLATIDRDGLDEFQLVELMKARARLISHLQAEFYTDMWKVAEVSKPFPGEGIYEFAREEIGSALSWTGRATDRHLSLAYQLVQELPQIGQALFCGDIDLPKAKVIADNAATLPQDTATRIIGTVLEKASDQTTSQIASRMRKLAITSDPQAVADRYCRSVKDRRLTLEPGPDGTATLYGFNLPTDQALQAFDHVDRIARSLKTGHEERTLDQLRTDVLLDLLQGKPHHGGTPRGIVHLRVDLTTLAGLDNQPGDVPGFGPIISDIARQIAREQQNSEWRVTVTHPDTRQPVWTGTTRRRPTLAMRRHLQSTIPYCVFPGCRRPATRSDLDHTQPWIRGGKTIISNLAPLCRRHHRTRHESRWRYRRLPDGSYQWTSPLGHRYQVKPEAP
jgi:hypothetical protein